MLFSNFMKGKKTNIRPTKDDTRTPLYIIFCGDLSGSMAEETKVIDSKGNAVFVPKIDQLNQGFRMTQKSLVRFMKENTRFQVKYQFIELNTYCKPLFPTYEPINDPRYNLGEVTFTAGGSTNISALFKSIISFLSHKHLGNYNRAVNIILLTDGIPTDVDGWALSEEAWKKEVDEFNSYLDEHDLTRNTEKYAIAVGPEAEPFGHYFAGEDHFFTLDESESIADKLDFITRLSLTNSTTISKHDDDLDSEDEDNFDSEDDEEEEDLEEDDLDEELEDDLDSEDFEEDDLDEDEFAEEKLDEDDIDEDEESLDAEEDETETADITEDDSDDDGDDDDGDGDDGDDGDGGDGDAIEDILKF